MYKKLLFTIFMIGCAVHLLDAQELAASITIQSNKVDNQVDPKIFPQLQIQLKDFINQRKWSNDAYSNEEKIDCSFYITIESEVGPGVYDAKLSIVSNRPIHNASYSSSVLNMQDANFTFKYQLSQPIEFNENRIQGADPLASNLTATIAYYIYIILGLDYDSFAPKAGMPYFNKALNIVYNAPEGSGISGWKSYDGQRNRYILIDNLTKYGNDKVHDIIYSYYREGLDQMTEKPVLAKSNILNTLINLQEMNEGAVSGMLIPILMQAKFSEIVGIFNNSDKATRKQLLTTLSSLDITNINKYKEKLE
ncbi:MAG: DUF4835 family protein [Chitinophagaceae bacterium]|nr:DUF4835 family protein [Chitinophagaceae bacterium]